MKQFLCLEDGPDQKAGNLYPDFHGIGPDLGVYAQAAWSCDFVEVETFEQDGQTWIKHNGGECPVPDEWDVNVLFADGEEDGAVECVGDTFFWNKNCGVDESDLVIAYRIISTGENEQPKAPSISEAARRVPESITVESFYSGEADWLSVGRVGGVEYIRSESLPSVDHGKYFDLVEAISINSKPLFSERTGVAMKDRDKRPLSPQEAAYAEKIAALQPQPEATMVFPASALRDMTDKTFASLLGMGQFIGGGE